MKPIRRILCIIVFLILSIVFICSIVLSSVQYILQGKVDMIDKVVKVLDNIVDYINPDC